MKHASSILLLRIHQAKQTSHAEWTQTFQAYRASRIYGEWDLLLAPTGIQSCKINETGLTYTTVADTPSEADITSRMDIVISHAKQT